MGLVKKKKQGGLSALRNQVRLDKAAAEGPASGPAGETLVLLLDRSGSMEESASGSRRHYYHKAPAHLQKWHAAKDAARVLIDRSYRSRVGVVAFDHGTVSWAVADDSRGIMPWLEKISPRGNTDFAMAIEAGRKLITEAPVTPVKRLVLMSDGHDGRHSGQDRLWTEVNLCVEQGIIIDCVAFGNDADRAALNEIAKRSQGVFREAADSQELVKKFAGLEARVRGLLGS